MNNLAKVEYRLRFASELLSPKSARGTRTRRSRFSGRLRDVSDVVRLSLQVREKLSESNRAVRLIPYFVEMKLRYSMPSNSRTPSSLPAQL